MAVNFRSAPQSSTGIFAMRLARTSAAKQFAEKLRLLCPAPKGASEFKELTASLKRCPDTKLEFFSKL
jgi:hypothetical protein